MNFSNINLKNITTTTLLSVSVFSGIAHAELSIDENNTSSTVVNTNTNVTPTDRQINKLMGVMHIDDKIQDIVDKRTLLTNQMDNIANLPELIDLENNDNLSNNQKAIGTQLFAALQNSMGSMNEAIEMTTDKDAMTQAYINAAKQYYTADEVQALIDFYDTDMGQSILEKQQQVNKTALQNALPDAKQIGQTAGKVAQAMPDMTELMKEIF